ncbi:hypothetical protein F5Y08DRAFT_320879 [Xylaria arbuscula]|nr:hypothetical protein F5Y08DRAFT_320879 [Xylaria arbuscula]
MASDDGVSDNDGSAYWSEIEVRLHGGSRLRLTNDDIAMPDMSQCIYVGMDKTGCYPVFVRMAEVELSDALRSLNPQDPASGDFFGDKSYLRAVSHRSNIRCQFAPVIALFRPGAVTALKLRVFNAHQQPLPKPRAYDESLWGRGGPWYPEDLLINWLPPEQDLLEPRLDSLEWRGPFRSYPWDRVPLLPPYGDAGTSSLRTCFLDILTTDYVDWKQLLMFVSLWAHYKLLPEEHCFFGEILPEHLVPGVKAWVTQMPVVLRAVEESGLGVFPHLAMAVRERTIRDCLDLEWSIDHHHCWRRLERDVLNHYREDGPYPISKAVRGYFYPGDFFGTENDRFVRSDGDEPPDRHVMSQFGCIRDMYRPACPSVAVGRRPFISTRIFEVNWDYEEVWTPVGRYPLDCNLEELRQAGFEQGIDLIYPVHATATGEDLHSKPVGNLDIKTSPRRPNMRTRVVNSWRRHLPSAPPCLPPVIPTPASPASPQAPLLQQLDPAPGNASVLSNASAENPDISTTQADLQLYDSLAPLTTKHTLSIRNQLSTLRRALTTDLRSTEMWTLIKQHCGLVEQSLKEFETEIAGIVTRKEGNCTDLQDNDRPAQDRKRRRE